MSDFKKNGARVVLVTGAASGIGAACAHRFLEEGAQVALLDIKKAKSPGPGSLVLRADIADEKAAQAAIRRVLEEFGRIDVLINNAAVLTPPKPVHSTTLAEFDKIVAVNLRGTFLMSREAYAALAKSRGCIVNLSSMAGVLGEKDHAIYAATKGAINALTKSMAVDYGPKGIRVVAVCPGGVSTDNANRVLLASPKGRQLLKLRDSVHALKRTATPDEVAGVVVFLASPAAKFMTGAVVPVSGGMECGYGIKY